MNKQSNVYTLVYIIVLVVLVGAALVFTSISLKDIQQDNANADKMRQILASVRVEVPAGDILKTYNEIITASYMVNSKGEKAEGAPDAFAINVAAESKRAADVRLLPVYECSIDGAVKYILPIYGSGLWGPIWGYVSVDADGTTIYGAYFDHAGETPGLGAEIAKSEFSDLFIGKHLFVDGNFAPVEVVKKGMKPTENVEYVDGISGATITSKGVSAMISNCLTPYAAFLNSLANNK